MRPVSFSRAGLALLGASLLVGGVIAGSVADAWGDRPPSAISSATAKPSPTPSAAFLPMADVPGEDLARLPRYPNSVRSGYEVVSDDRYRLIAAEYLVDATVDEVRAFYQTVIAEHGWERADISFSHGEWAYVLVDGSTEALIEIEEHGGLTEIDLQLSQPLAAPTPPPTPVPTQPPAPPPPDDDDDDDDDASDDDATDD